MEELLEKEYNVTFDTFTHKLAFQMGENIKKTLDTYQEPLGIEIVLQGLPVFSYYKEGTTLNTKSWIEGKRKVVEFFGRSSAYIEEWAKSLENKEDLDKNTYTFPYQNFYNKFSLDPIIYRICGGSFPILIKNIGMIGSITISGLSRKEDHLLCEQALFYIKTHNP